MNMHVNADGSAIAQNNSPFEQSKSIVPCVLGQMIIERRIPAKYSFLIGDNFFRNPEPFNKVYSEQLEVMEAKVPEQIKTSPMFLHQVLCRSIEVALFTMACQFCKESEPVNYLDKVIETKPYNKVIAEAFAEKIIDEEFAAEMTKIFEGMGDGFNVHCAIAFEYKEFQYSEENLERILKQIITDTKQQREQEKAMQAQQEAFANMLNMQNGDQPMDQEAFEKALRAAGFVPAEGIPMGEEIPGTIEETINEPIGAMVDVEALEPPTTPEN